MLFAKVLFSSLRKSFRERSAKDRLQPNQKDFLHIPSTFMEFAKDSQRHIYFSKNDVSVRRNFDQPPCAST